MDRDLTRNGHDKQKIETQKHFRRDGRVGLLGENADSLTSIFCSR
jgi:hypothetical protein